MSLSAVGRPLSELDTPALCIDLDLMESNIVKMATTIRERGKQWRPHAKCHKTPAIAWNQIHAGAMGVTVAKASEAEVYAAAGIRDILIANMVAGEQKLERIAALKPSRLIGCHTPVIGPRQIEDAITALRTAPYADIAPEPDEEVLQMIQKMLLAGV